MTIATPRTPRPVDHLVLPTVDLDTARQRLEALGFTVAPSAQHPFGTENACVFFSDNTYLEPLAIAQRETCETEARNGNVLLRAIRPIVSATVRMVFPPWSWERRMLGQITRSL